MTRVLVDEDELRHMRCRTASLAGGGREGCEAVLVPIPDFVFEAGGIYEFDPEHPEYGLDEEGRRCLRLDVHIVPAIKTLWAAGIVTRSCCCGHGSGWGIVSVLPECGPSS